MLPGQDGFACCRSLRTQSQVPVIMLTAKFWWNGSDYWPRNWAPTGLSAKTFNPRETARLASSNLRRWNTVKLWRWHPVAHRFYGFSHFHTGYNLARVHLRRKRVVGPALTYNLLMLFFKPTPVPLLTRDLDRGKTHVGVDSAPLIVLFDVMSAALRQRFYREDARHPQLIKNRAWPRLYF